MFVVMLEYIQPLDAVDAVIPAHVDYLKRYYAEGIFLASGRKVPRTGGVILARSESREALMEILHEDPFYQSGVAEYAVTEFTATMAAAELETLKDTPA